MTGADVSARVAWADDAPSIAAVQVRAWRESYAGVLPEEMLAGLDPAAFAEAGREAMARPADARHRVLVALERNLVTGFVVTGPAGDPDCDPVSTGELVDLTVDPAPAWRGARVPAAPGGRRHPRGRPLQPCGQLAAGGRRHPARVPDLRGLGRRRRPPHARPAGDGGTTIKQVRLHTALVDGA